MGTDIHLHTEVKIDGQWRHYGNPNVRQSYKLFARMAGICGDDYSFDAMVEPRGIPRDATELTLFDYHYWQSDGHTHSWR
jgi:hypothetical protein